MLVIKAPKKIINVRGVSIFLAGSIEMGLAEDWQKSIINELADENVTILNPRRDDWDKNWSQNKDDKNFKTQVEWELGALEKADIIALYFDPNTKSPISLLEFGLYAKSRKLIVCCPDGFWRKGNVDITCTYYRIPITNNLLEFMSLIKNRVGILSKEINKMGV